MTSKKLRNRTEQDEATIELTPINRQKRNLKINLGLWRDRNFQNTVSLIREKIISL